MSHWNSRGLRGSTFEELINITNEAYRKKGLALIQKIPTPITPLKLDNETRTITSAYFEQKSTVDYIGAVQGIPVCFDAKETTLKSLPLQNIHEHQIQFMEDFEKQEGIAFLLVNFKVYSEIFYLPFKTLKSFYEKSLIGGRKSIPYSAFDRNLMISGNNGYINYLYGINNYLNNKRGDEGEV